MDQRSKELHRYIYVNFVTIKSSYIKLDFVIVIKVKIQSFNCIETQQSCFFKNVMALLG